MKMFFVLCSQPRVGKIIAQCFDFGKLSFYENDCGNHHLSHVDVFVSRIFDTYSIRYFDGSEMSIPVVSKRSKDFSRKVLNSLKKKIKEFFDKHPKMLVDKSVLNIELI